MIQPAYGDLYDSRRHEAYAQDGMRQALEKNSKRAILWVLCPGFRFEEDGFEASRVRTIKARVILQ